MVGTVTCCMLSVRLPTWILRVLTPFLVPLLLGENICSPHLPLICTSACPFCSGYLTFLLCKERTYPLNFKLQGDTAIISEPAVSQVLSCTWSHFIVTVIISVQAGKVGPWPHAPTPFSGPKKHLFALYVSFPYGLPGSLLIRATQRSGQIEQTLSWTSWASRQKEERAWEGLLWALPGSSQRAADDTSTCELWVEVMPFPQRRGHLAKKSSYKVSGKSTCAEDTPLLPPPPRGR